jgi:DUF4097 and DUF4098 domain-containing protein YvlB
MPSFETDQPVAVAIDLAQVMGTVQVIAGDRTDTVVAVNPSDRTRQADVETAQHTVVDLSNGNLIIRAPKRRGIAGYLGLGRSGSLNVTVEVPEGSSLTADAGFADFRCDGTLGDVDVKTGAGSVRLDRVGAVRVHSGAGRVAVERSSGDAEIVTAGDITLGTVAGNAEIKNHTGTTRIGRVEGDVRVKSANGDITVEAAGRDVTIKNANGGIRLGQITRGSVSIETACGGLEIGIGEGTAAWVDANTSFGQIHNTLSPADDPERSAETVQVHARTSFGDVLITRSNQDEENGGRHA